MGEVVGRGLGDELVQVGQHLAAGHDRFPVLRPRQGAPLTGAALIAATRASTSLSMERRAEETPPP